MEWGVLGPLTATRDGRPLELGSKQRALLALLLINPNQVVSTDRIIDELWGEDSGSQRQNSLWVVVSRLRSELEPDREKRSEGTILITRPPGYVLVVDPADIDSHRFEALALEGRSLLETHPGNASIVLNEALALWRGRAYEEFTYSAFATPEIARLETLRLNVVGDRMDADLRFGRHRESIGELKALACQHPSHERFASLLMLALYRSGRQVEALQAFAEHRAHMAEEYGLEPSAGLTDLEERILLSDPDLSSDIRPQNVGDRLSIRGYELREEIGSGPTGTVYSAFQPSVGRQVAITVIRSDLADDPDFIRSFELEAQRITHLDHPRIAPLYDFWREPGRAFMVMPMFERGNLLDVLTGGTVEAGEAVHFIEQAARALAAAHRLGVVHGDVRPENVLVDGGGNAYLANLGLRYQPAVVVGDSDEFRAPEFDTFDAATPHSDIYSLGRLASMVMRFCPDVADLTAVVERACSEQPADRFDDVEEFLAALAATTGAEENAIPETGPATPYRGLRAFDENDAPLFFGRERLVERLLTRLGYSGPNGGRFVAVVGPSGSGKSSLVRAGLLPALRNGALPGSDAWFIVTMTPGHRPFEALAEALRSVAIEAPTDLADRLRTDGITSVVEEIMPADTAQLLVVVDQAEELFSLAPPSQAEEFMDAISASALARHSIVRIVATLRADFYDQPLRHARFGELVRLGTEVITPMGPRELERAITGPAAGVGVTIEPAVVAAVAADMAHQPSALPLMQFALTELFEGRSSSTITIDDYHDIGGISAALARRADQLFDGFDPGRQQAAKQILLRLVTLTEGSADTRRRTLTTELASIGKDSTAIVDAFARRRLFVYDRDPVTRSPTVEIAHESLLSEWERLAGWIDANRQDLHAQRRLAEAAGEWRARDHSPDYLLAGARLAQYDGWLEHPPVRLTPDERHYLISSQEHSESELEIERRHNRRLRRLVRGVGVALIVALLAAGVALDQRRRAGVETQRALDNEQAAIAAEGLASQARADAEVDRLTAISSSQTSAAPDLAILLALEANRRRDDIGTRTAVQRSIAAQPALVGMRPSPLDEPSATFVSNDGSVAMTVSTSSTAASVVWFDPETGERLGGWQHPDSGIGLAAISGDGSTAAFSLSDGSLQIVDTTGNKISNPEPVDRVIRSLALDDSGGRLLIDADGSARVVDTGSGATVLDHPTTADRSGEPDGFGSVLASDGSFFAIESAWGPTPSSEQVVVAEAETTFGYQVVDSASGEVLHEYRGEPTIITALALSPAGRLAAGLADGSIHTRSEWDEAPPAELAGAATPIGTIAIGRDGTIAFSTDVELRHIAGNGTASAGSLTIGGGIAGVALVDSATTVVTLDNGGVALLDRRGSNLMDLRRRTDYSVGVINVAGVPHYGVGRPDGLVGSYRTADDDELVTETTVAEAFPNGFGGQPYATPNGEWILGLGPSTADPWTLAEVATGDFTLVDLSAAHRAATGEPLTDNHLISARPAPDGQAVFVIATDLTGGPIVAFWVDPDSNRVTAGPMSLPTIGRALILDGGEVAISAANMAVTILPPGLEGEARTIPGTDGYSALDQNRETGELLIGGSDGGVGVVDLGSGTVELWDQSRGSITAGAFAPVGGHVAVLAPAVGVQLYEASTGQRVGVPMITPPDSPAMERWMAWSPDGGGVWIESIQGPVRFAVGPDSWRDIACSMVHRELTAEEWRTYVSDTDPQVGACR